uniref:Big-1 domain-containing protein n=1 Tax=Anopheles maculatus TaxID=74869 RepID=A0A182S6P6_9DIPT
ISIKLPPYTAGSNVYTLGAVAYDNQGNASNPSSTQITVTPQVVSKYNSTLAVSPADISADGVSTSLITLNLNDVNNLPVKGMADRLTLDVHFIPDATASQPVNYPLLTKVILTEINHAPIVDNFSFSVEPEEIIADGVQSSTLNFTVLDNHHQPITGLKVAFEVTGGPEVTLSPVTENNGVYSAMLSGIVAGHVTVAPTINGDAVAVESHSITLTADHRTATIGLTVVSDDALADGIDVNKIEARVTDQHGNPLEALPVEFHADNGATVIPPEGITDAEGLITVKLANINPGVTTVTASGGGHEQRIELSFMSETPEKLLIYRNGAELTEHPVVGDTLVAVAMCSIALCNGASVHYQWEAESAVGSGVFVAIPGATSETL